MHTIPTADSILLGAVGYMHRRASKDTAIRTGPCGDHPENPDCCVLYQHLSFPEVISLVRIPQSDGSDLEGCFRRQMLRVAMAEAGLTGQADMFARCDNQLCDTAELFYRQQTMNR